MGVGNTIAQSHALVRLILGQHRDVTSHDRTLVRLLATNAQDDANHSIHVGNVDLAIVVHIAIRLGIIFQDHPDNGIDIGNIHLGVTIHVASWCGINTECR